MYIEQSTAELYRTTPYTLPTWAMDPAVPAAAALLAVPQADLLEAQLALAAATDIPIPITVMKAATDADTSA